MRYSVATRLNDFDLFLYDANQTLVFFATKISYTDVTYLFLEETCKHYLVFSFFSGFANVLIDLPVQQHFDLFDALRILNSSLIAHQLSTETVDN